ncbi:MAG: ferric reductase-like transmembrane domain-containing protein [Piscinibacter sp.]|uniref:ferric reductase-like transmembrane domain-containing protein n=1 Tax=Piscinibacter sp. TaxID=1903157 RepID=UPI00258EF7E3|nr:ferric reductase-like transmembrane domain-containing protein [Piscinibacter sp.]MCW5662268.1 ferric reductase-like transmembrane domain-containing protein [Piscinibacter sp.]
MGRPGSFTLLRLLAWAACLAPAAWLALLAGTGRLGADPLARLMSVSGLAAVSLLLATLAVTPLRRLSVAVARRLEARWGRRVSDWNRLVRLRRLLGVSAFAYTTLHLGFFVVLDLRLDLEQLMLDLRERRFVALGLAAWALLLPLATTSTNAAMRALGGRWQKLHLLVHPAALLALLHDATHTRHGHTAPWTTGTLLLVLLALRLHAWWRGERAPATEVPERGASRERAAALPTSRCSRPSAPSASAPRTVAPR